MIRSLRITALFVVVLSTLGTQATAQNLPPYNLPPYKAGEVLIGYRPNSSLSQRASALALVNGASLKSKGRVALATQTDLSIDHIAVSLPVSQAIDLLQDHPAIAFVEPTPQFINIHT